MNDIIHFDVIESRSGKCLSLRDADGDGGTRIAGNKIWNGTGHTEHTFRVKNTQTNREEIAKAFGLYTQEQVDQMINASK